MKINPVLVLQIGIDAAVGDAGDSGELLSGLRIEICVAAAGIDPDETEAQIGKAIGIIGAARNVAAAGCAARCSVFPRNWLR
jgi:hypothetical protein